MSKKHTYNLVVEWTGNKGEGTKNYLAYDRNHTVFVDSKKEILCSSDPAFRGDKTRHNPEELFLASIATCHMLWYLHLCSDNGIIVNSYRDSATGIMQETENGGGHFTEVILYPIVVVEDESMIELANKLHQKANEFCFIANSCNFPIHHQPNCKVKDA
jgi:organic hydroperoxide reductase OsmC/OhrA